MGGGQLAWTALLAADGLPSYAGARGALPRGERTPGPPLVLFFSRFLLRMRMREREGRGRGRPGGVGRARGEKSGIPRIVAVEFG